MSDKPYKMTKELHLKLVEAWWDGELEFYHIGAWKGATFTPLEGDRPQDYRIRPKPRLRPWKPEEVPMPCYLRFRSAAYQFLRFAVLGSNGAGIIHIHPTTMVVNTVLYHIALDELDHSTDGGLTWKPCGVPSEESQ